MDFGVLGLEGLLSPNSKAFGSGFLKQQRSGSEDVDLRALKMAKTMPMPCHQSNQAPARSSSLLSADNMLSFSSLTSEATKNGAFLCYQHAPSSCTRNAASGSLASPNMHRYFAGIRGPFTPSQWSELQHQALIYKYITANVPVPSNLLIPIRRSFNAYGLSYPSSSFGWGSFHMGFSGSADPELGRCRRTDGKKWRCSRDAVADQKYCDRHINRGRHRSRKPVEGQTGHAASGITDSKVLIPMPSSSAPSSLVIQKRQFKNMHTSPEPLVNRMQETQGLSMNLEESTFPISKQDHPFEELSQLEFGLVPSDSLLNPSHSCSFLDFGDQETHEQHPLHQFMDDCPKDQSNPTVIPWPEEQKPNWTQLSMSIPMSLSDFSSSSSSPTYEKPALSPLRQCQELDPVQMGFGVNWTPNSWKNSMGGPLGEVLANSSTSSCKNSSELNFLAEGRDSSPELRSSPAGVHQESSLGSLSHSSSGSIQRGDILYTHGRMSFFDNVLASSSIPSL